MKTIYTNKTGFEIEVEGTSVAIDGEITLEEEVNPKEIIVYNDGGCNVYISNGYTTNGGVKIVEIYID